TTQCDSGTGFENYDYFANVTNNCSGSVSAAITWFLEASNDPGFATFDTVTQTTPTPMVFPVGTTPLSGTFTNQHLYGPYQYYRVRLNINEGGTCLFDFRSDPDFVCPPSLLTNTHSR